MDTVGFGTGRLPEDAAYNAIRTAIDVGYRFFDTARIYGTESVLAAAIEDAAVDRSDLFIGTKIDSHHLSEGAIQERVEESLSSLRTDYIDLLYVHWPAHEYDPRRTFEVFADLREAELVRSVGICNVTADILEEAIEHSPTPIDFVQVELHPYLYQRSILNAASEHGAKVVAESPLARGRVLKDEVVGEVAAETGTSPAEVVLAWCLTHGTIPVPSSSTPAHIRENRRATAVNLAPDQVRRLDDLNAGYRINDYEFAPWNR